MRLGGLGHLGTLVYHCVSLCLLVSAEQIYSLILFKAVRRGLIDESTARMIDDHRQAARTVTAGESPDTDQVAPSDEDVRIIIRTTEVVCSKDKWSYYFLLYFYRTISVYLDVF